MYDVGENPGGGARGRLVEFKADVLNQFVKEQDTMTVIELGCGDGSQLHWTKCESYPGFGVSPKAVSLCKALALLKTFKFLLRANR